MKHKVQRDVLSRMMKSDQNEMCAPPGFIYIHLYPIQSGRMSLCALKGSLTAELAMVLPFFLMIFLACISFFSRFASAAELSVRAAAEAKKTGIAVCGLPGVDSAEITICKTVQTEPYWICPFEIDTKITKTAVCRAWIGFTELELKETYVYITPEGSVYHLRRDCTHLLLSIQCVTKEKAAAAKNEYGQNYRACEFCGENAGALVYITSEGDCYHSDRTCSGLKRTVRQVPISQAGGRSCCIRCMSREE